MKATQKTALAAVLATTLALAAPLASATETATNAPQSAGSTDHAVQGTDRGGSPDDGNAIGEPRGTDRGGIDALLQWLLGPRS